MRWVLSIALTAFLFISCNEQRESGHLEQKPLLEIVETQGHTPSPDSIKTPVVIRAGAPRKVKAGAPTITLLNPNNGDEGGFSNMRNYTIENGLALDAVVCAVKDKLGNIWFGTNGGGVSRYDGRSRLDGNMGFTNFTTTQGLANNVVRSIIEDKQGNMWFGTYGGGISCYNGKSFTNFTTAQGLANNIVWSIVEDREGNIWFGTDGGGVSCYSSQSKTDSTNLFTNFTTTQGLANNNVWSIIEDKSGNLWFGTFGGVSKYDGKSFTNFTTKEGLANNIVRSIAEDKKGNIWIGTDGGGVSCYSSQSKTDSTNLFTNFTTDQGLVNNNVWSIAGDKSGNLWFGTLGGVSRYDDQSPPGSKLCFTNFTTEQGLAHNSVRSITEDESGNIWLGTYGGGINCYNGKSFTAFTVKHGLPNDLVRSIAEDRKGNLWFGTYGGVSKYDGKSFTNFTTSQGLVNNLVFSITEDKKGNLWFGTDRGGVCRFDGFYFSNYTTSQGLVNDLVYCITEDKRGNLWFGTYGGNVSCYDGKSFTNFTTDQGLSNYNIRRIQEDKLGNLWFATQGGGVLCYNGKSFKNFTTTHGLANNIVFSVTEDKIGNLWFGTYGGGISKYDGKSFVNFTDAQGLCDNLVTQLLITKDHNVAIGTNYGVGVLKGFSRNKQTLNAGLLLAINNLSNEELKKYQPAFEIYNTSTGYPIKDVNSTQHAMYCDSKGILWIATASEKTGLLRFDYNAVHRNPHPLKVVLQNVKINEEPVCWYSISQNNYDSATIVNQEAMVFGKSLSIEARDSIQKKFQGIRFDDIRKFYPIPENLTLPYEYNQVNFEFSAIELARPNLVKYQYFLEGYDQKWSPITSKTTVSYNNVYEGTYTFKLKARSPDGIWSEPIEYKFKVLPPLWRTWWMFIVYGIVLVLFVASIVWINGWRLRRKARDLTIKIRKATQEVKAQQKIINEQQIRELELIAIRAQMNPHFLFNVLASIQMLINKSDTISANNALAKFGKLMRLILENSEKQTIFLGDEIEMLKLYVELESLLLSFKCKIIVDPLLDIESIPIPTMIIQPYVENAIKHGISGLESDREVIINFQNRQNNLFCTIQDNGIGRQMAEANKGKYSKHKSMGTRLASDRLKIMNKQIASNVEVAIKDLVDDQGLSVGTLVELTLPITIYQN